MARLSVSTRTVVRLLVLVCVLAACSSNSQPRALPANTESSSTRTVASPHTSVSTDRLCAAALQVSKAIGTFNGSKSQTFDAIARELSQKLEIQADSAASIAGSGDLKTVLHEIAQSVKAIVAAASDDSSPDLAPLRRATANYVASTQRYATLLASKCPR